MIKARWFGHSMWKVWNEKTSLIIDPFSNIGYPVPQDERADFVMSSHDHFDHNNISLIKGSPKIINKQGYYSYEYLTVETFAVWHDENEGKQRGRNLLIRFILDDVAFLHCGDLGHVPAADIFTRLGRIDVLMIPVGGFYTIDAGAARTIVNRLSPQITLPMHYKTPVLDFPISGVEPFLKMMDNVVKINAPEVDLNRYLRGNRVTLVLNYE
ncbi:MAG: MBL fold metallo-hydrolase [Candidatus Cloacimonetes bacterium]|nr:MBL fold metallo-hydrolase [Candidatus Cloacimonadota bacterium]